MVLTFLFPLPISEFQPMINKTFSVSAVAVIALVCVHSSAMAGWSAFEGSLQAPYLTAAASNGWEGGYSYGAINYGWYSSATHTTTTQDFTAYTYSSIGGSMNTFIKGSLYFGVTERSSLLLTAKFGDYFVVSAGVGSFSFRVLDVTDSGSTELLNWQLSYNEISTDRTSLVLETGRRYQTIIDCSFTAYAGTGYVASAGYIELALGPVPTPAAASLLAFAGLITRRRRI
jgi:hypothetical protein